MSERVSMETTGTLPYTGVLFDLFGTLVTPFRQREHMDALRECAKLLGISFEDCHRHWGATFPRRMRGEFIRIADNFDWIVRQTHQRAPDCALARAEETYERFSAAGLEPVPGALELLAWLAARGIRIGLVSNCAPDIPRVWNTLAFANYIDYCAFSCQVGAAKPEAAIYRAALNALDLLPHETLYVGDGSDQELSGAARCGMHAVLIATDLSNTYDVHRHDVDGWSGPVIHTLADLPRLMATLPPA